MPLIKRHVEPVHLSRTVIGRGIKNELECVTNNTLSGVIRQLSNLSKHAEDIFGDLYQEANSVFIRANILQDRIDKLTVKVTKLDATQDPVLLQDIHLRKAYKSSTLMDQQVVAGHTMPSTMRELYMLCDKPPKLNLLTPYRYSLNQVSLQDILACTPFQSKVILDQEMLSKEKRPTAVHYTYVIKCEAPPRLSILTPYREDGKEGLEFYTKPRYFFELWCEEQKKNISLLKQERRHRRKQRHPREKGIVSNQPRAARTRKEQWESMKHGADLRQHHAQSSDDHNMAPVEELHEDSPVQNQTQIHDDRQAYSGSPYQDPGGLGRQEPRRSVPNRPMAAPPPPPQPMSNGGPPMNTGYQNEYNLQQHVPSPPEYPDAPPYQPHMISDQGYRQDLEHNEPQEDHRHQIPVAPPPPAAGYYPETPPMHNVGQSSYIPAPPPPPNIGFVPPPPPVPLGPAAQTVTSSPAKAPPVTEEPEDNPRSDLLSAIRTGIKLREVDRSQAKKQNSDSTPNSVAAILARRLAVELSDSEDDSNTSSDWEEDDTSWD